jgi:hypothetical protein
MCSCSILILARLLLLAIMVKVSRSIRKSQRHAPFSTCPCCPSHSSSRHSLGAAFADENMRHVSPKLNHWHDMAVYEDRLCAWHFSLLLLCETSSDDPSLRIAVFQLFSSVCVQPACFSLMEVPILTRTYVYRCRRGSPTLS